MQTILNKIAQGKKAQPKRATLKSTKPNKVAVKLSVIDDIEGMLDWFERAESEASYLAYEYGDQIIEKIEQYRNEIGEIDDYIVNGETQSLEYTAETILENLRLLEEKSNELGINPNELYADFDELKSRVENAPSIVSDAQDKYWEIVDYAGFLTNFWK